MPGLATGGQPNATTLDALKGASCEVVLDLRDPMEPRPLREPDAIRAAGIEYLNIPVHSASMTPETFARVRQTLKDLVAAGRTAFVHCGSGNRVGATMIPYLMLDRGMSEDEAVETAMRIGTRSAELIELALEYVKSQAGGASTDASR